jgi:steroid 5-alpha reductase family enzyme
MYLNLILEFLPTLTYCIVYFFVIWWIAKQLNNWSVVDIFWAYGFSLIGAKYLIINYKTITGPSLILIILTILWSLRLGTHLAKRIFKDFSHEDGRYLKLRKNWGKNVEWKMFQFYMLQALILALLLIPIISSVLHEQKTLSLIHYIGLIITVFAFVGETIADQQLRGFKKIAAKNEVCNVGLWAWTRHPNYFFEWLIWVGFALLSYKY